MIKSRTIEVGMSKIKNQEIDEIKELLQNKDLKDVERFNLNIYLKSLLKNEKK